MGSNLAASVGASTTVTLNGQKYTLQKLDMVDLGEFEQHMLDRRRDEAVACLQRTLKGIPERIWAETIAKATIEATKGFSLAEAMNTMHGGLWLVHRAFAKDQPNLGFDEFRKTIVASGDALEEVMNALESLTDGGAEEAPRPLETSAATEIQ